MKKLTSWQVKRFLSTYKTDERIRVLEIGAGGTDGLVQFFPNITTLDIEASKKPDVVGDAHKLPFSSESFDVIVCSEALEHFYNPFIAVAEMHRVLVPKGLVLVTTRFIFPVHDAPHDYFRYTPYGMRELFKHFEVVEEEVESDAFGTVAILLQRIMFQTKLRGGKFSKGLVYLLVLFINLLDPLIVERYGDITRKEKVPILLASGVFFAGRKKV